MGPSTPNPTPTPGTVQHRAEMILRWRVPSAETDSFCRCMQDVLSELSRHGLNATLLQPVAPPEETAVWELRVDGQSFADVMIVFDSGFTGTEATRFDTLLQAATDNSKREGRPETIVAMDGAELYRAWSSRAQP